MGNITPCALLPIKILNLNENSNKENQKKYVKNKKIIDLFERNLKGKCKNCKLNRQCGGCRAIPYGMSGDFLGEDPTCFYEVL